MVFGMMNAFAQTVNVDDVTIKAGETKLVSINLNNSQTNIVSFQMDLTLPDGITLNKAGCSLGSRITDNDQELTIGKQPDGSIRLTSTSFALKPMSGTSGEIIKLSLTAASNAKGGTASIKNVILATSSSETLTSDNTTFKVNVLYTLTYILDGEVYRTESMVYGTPIDIEPALKKTGYTFSGWSEIPATMPNHDVTVTGTFSINSYSLTYEVDGQVYKTSTVVYGMAITPEAEPTKEGYTFSGWNGLPATMPANDVVVTGSFSINSYNLTYIVDGEVYKTESIEYGSTIELEPALKKTGYTFSGWSEIPATMPAHDVTVTGSFTINKYKLTYILDGVEYKSYEIDYASAITPEPVPTKEGHTFSGWNGLPATMPANDVVVTGSFTINSYKLTYIVDGEVYKTESIVYGTPIDPEPALKKTGYSFSGWSAIPETMPAHDVTVTGTFTINKYKLTYIVDGAEYKSYEIDYASTITPEAAPAKEGYTFSGWSEIPATMPAHDVEVTGSFSINSYTLTYKVDGQVYKTSTVIYGTAITSEAEPTREGYTFSGWSEIPATMPAHDVTVTGSFSINSYELTYKVDGVIYKTLSVAYGTAITPEPVPTKEGHTFSGWSEIPATMPAHDVEVTGSFSINSYTLTYILDGEVYKTESVVYGTTLVPEPALQKEGYTFSGWSAIPTTMPAHDVTVTGSFSINSYKLTYKVDGETYKSSTVVYGTAITPEPAPAKEGYTFSGWSEIPATMPAHDVTVTGSFSINSYTLTYKVDGMEYKTYTLNYGTVITPEPVPTKEGYTFSGWSEIPETMPAHDMEVTGSFSINSYILTYKVDGMVYKTSTVIYGTAITPEAEPIKEGHTFSGWSEIPATMPAHDVTVTGTFTVNNYTLTYVVDGEAYKTSTVAYGTTLIPEAAPAKAGHTFSGWSEIPETMPAHDVTVTGTFSINSYTLTYMLDGEVYKTMSVVYGTPLEEEPAPTKEGYTFSGWSPIPETMPARDVTVTGSFSINSYKLSYIVDGEVYKTYTLNYGTAIVPEAEPVKDGYTFSGWSEIPATMPAHDVTVTGSFIVNLATGIALDRESLVFNTTDAQKLNVTLTPDNLVNKTVIWSSTDSDIATVDEEGFVTPVNNGEAYIIVCITDGTELKDSCKVTVDFKAATLCLDKEEVTITELKSQKLNASIIPDKASQVVTWSSSDASIVAVDETGTITPLRNGKAVITATTTDGTELKATCKVTVSIPSQLEAIVTQTTLAVRSRNGVAEAKDIRVTIDGETYDLGSEEGKLTGLAPDRTYHVETNANISGYNWTEEFDATTADIAVNFDCKASPTTLDISAFYDAGDATVINAGFDGEEEKSVLSLSGLEPDQTYDFTYYITTEEGGTATYTAQFATEALTLKISQTKVVAIGDVVVVATSNIAEEENVNVGFEWRRYDWPDEIENRSGGAYIYSSTIEGSIKNLNAEKFWKIRPYFQSQAGNSYYGDWVTIDPSDASYFEPSVHTYKTISISGNTAEVRGFVMQGSDNVEQQGFVYWKDVPSSTRRGAKGVPSNAKIVEANGNMMVVSLEGLDYETEYRYVAFVKTSGNEMYYGEEQTFRTGEMDPDGIKEIESLTQALSKGEGDWYDLNGRKLDKPQKGINIIRYSDGTNRKVLFK